MPFMVMFFSGNRSLSWITMPLSPLRILAPRQPQMAAPFRCSRLARMAKGRQQAIKPPPGRAAVSSAAQAHSTLPPLRKAASTASAAVTRAAMGA